MAQELSTCEKAGILQHKQVRGAPTEVRYCGRLADLKRGYNEPDIGNRGQIRLIWK